MNVLFSHFRQMIRKPLFWLAAVYVAVGVIYVLVTPALEKIDEHWHYMNIVYLRQHHTMPPFTSEGWLKESVQPPLYYVIAALGSIGLPDDPNMERALGRNPYMWDSVPGYRNDNRNVYLHPPDMTPLVLESRLVSLLFGLGTLLVSYSLAAQLFPRRTLLPIAAAAAVAYQPNFWFFATSINNDAAINFLGTVTVALLMRRLQKGNWRWFAPLMGGVLGLSLITKVSAGVFIPLVGLALLVIHRGLGRAFWRDAAIIGVIAFLIGSWWYIRNAVVYHDPLLVGYFTSRPNIGYTWSRLKSDLLAIERTYWANEARVFISPIALDALLIWWGRISAILLAIGVLVKRHSLRAEWPMLVILGSWPLTFWAFLVGYWDQKGSVAMGRLLFPAVAPLMLLLLWGWHSALPARLKRWGVMVSAGAIMLTGILIPFVSLYPLFHPYREWNAAQVERPADIIYTDQTGAAIARLIGYNLPKSYATPGDYYPIELCWEPLSRTDVPYTMFIHLLDNSQMASSNAPGIWGQRETYPGLGNRPTDRWPLHKAFCDTVLVSIFPETPTPLGAAIEVGFTDPNRQKRLLAVDKQGDPVGLATIGSVPILSSQNLSPKDNPPSEYTLDNAIGLAHTRVDVGNSLTLTLTWQSHKPVPYDATIFVHVIGKDGDIMAQLDRQPLDGRFPTSYWQPGQIITDVISLPMPTDQAPLTCNVGMYLWPSMQRLPVKNVSGQPVRDDMIVVDVP